MGFIKRLITGSLLLGTLLYAGDINRAGYYTSPDATTRLLKSHWTTNDTNVSFDIDALKENLASQYGLQLGGDYHLLGMEATNALGKRQSLGGVLRLYGEWTVWKKASGDHASLVFKVEHRHALNGISPVDFSDEVGYAGLFHSTMSDQGTRLTTLYWKQTFSNRDGMIYAGFLDVSEYIDVYLLISPWDAFQNMVFATGSATIGGLPDGALGVMAAGWLNENMYIVGSIVDANADAHNPFKGFDRLFNDLRTFKSLEIGWTTGKDNLFFDNFHLTFWQMDARPKAGIKEGWGTNFSLTHTFDKQWMGFLRGGYSKDGGALLSKSISTGFGYMIPDRKDLLGVGLNWGSPNKELYGDTRDQWTSELFYRYQFGKDMQITPSLQLIAHPAINTHTNIITLFGVRAQIAF